MNVVDRDGTAIIFFEVPKGGTRLTRNLCALEKRPYVLVDARRIVDPSQAALVWSSLSRSMASRC
jgi:hypothetical protein